MPCYYVHNERHGCVKHCWTYWVLVKCYTHSPQTSWSCHIFFSFFSSLLDWYVLAAACVVVVCTNVQTFSVDTMNCFTNDIMMNALKYIIHNLINRFATLYLFTWALYKTFITAKPYFRIVRARRKQKSSICGWCFLLFEFCFVRNRKETFAIFRCTHNYNNSNVLFSLFAFNQIIITMSFVIV